MDVSSAHLGDTTLHDEEIGVVDVELHTLEQRLDSLLCHFVAIEEVLGYIGDGNLGRALQHVQSKGAGVCTRTCLVTVIWDNDS